MVNGIRERHEILKVPPPEMVIVDNCCQVRRQLVASLPNSSVILDVHHFLMRLVQAQGIFAL
jgi:hypothetical protein